MDGDCMDLSLVARQARHNSERWFPSIHTDQFLDVFYALALGGEVGEVQNLLKKKMRDQNFNLKQHCIGSELADVFTYLLLLADELHIDLMAEFEAKQAICEARWGR